MIELYFLFYHIPKMMSRLAREKNRSALRWSLAGIGAWIGGELMVGIIFGVIYEIGVEFWGWPAREPTVVRVLFYIAAIAAAIASVTIVRAVLVAKPRAGEPLLSPPPPPQF